MYIHTALIELLYCTYLLTKLRTDLDENLTVVNVNIHCYVLKDMCRYTCFDKKSLDNVNSVSHQSQPNWAHVGVVS